MASRTFVSLVVLCAVFLVGADTPPPQDSEACCWYQIEGTVFNDLNNNTINDSEPLLAGWTVEVLDNLNQVQASTVTNGSGYYSFSNPVICGTDFWIRLQGQPNWAQTFPINNGMHMDNLSDCSGTFFGPYDFGVFHTCADFSKTYTLDADFLLGTLNGVVTNSDQLELSTTGTTYEFAWIANAGEGTISKVSTITGKEVGRYYTGPPINGNYNHLSPSRTVVDKDGNCWVANRYFSGASSVTEILNTGGSDHNTDNTIQTSGDFVVVDGIIQPNEMYPWGQDERVVRHYIVGGANPDNIARGLAIDKAGFLWAALFSGKRVIKFDPNLPISVYGPHMTASAPPEMASVDVGPYTPYGIALSCNGFLYGSTLNSYGFEVDPGAASGGVALVPYMTPNAIEIPLQTTYGLAADAQGIVWYALVSSSNAIRWDPTVGVNNPALGWSFTTPLASALGPGRGITVDFAGNIWMACNGVSSVAVFDASGNWLSNHLTTTQIPVGIGTAQDGNMVVVGSSSWDWAKLDNGTGANIPLAGPQLAGSAPYTYSDFTGNLYNIVAQQQGFWPVITDGGYNALLWNFIGWNDAIPAGTAVAVEARVSSSLIQLGNLPWIPITVNGPQTPMPGRYIETRVRLERAVECNAPFVTPILYDLTVEAVCDTCQFLSCPGDTEILCENMVGAQYFYPMPELSPICDSAYTVTCVPPSGSTFPLGSTTVICTASGNNLPDIICTFVVTVTGDCLPTPTGACCVQDSCQITTGALCEQLGGIYFGDGSNCSNGCDFTCLRPPQGMSAWWPFDGSFGNITPNLAAPSSGGTLVGPPASQSGYVTNSYNFAGAEYIEVADALSVDLSVKDFSFDCWVYTSASTLMPILDKRDDATPLTGYSFFLSNGYPGLQVALSGSWTNYVLSAGNGGSAAMVADGAWHHIGVTVDRNVTNGIQFYVDGSPVGSPFNPVPYMGSLDNIANLWIGRSYPISSAGSYFVGSIDEVEIFKRALTAAEMNSLWLADTAGKCREACYVTNFATCCSGSPAQVTLSICNYDAVAHIYSWGLSPTPYGVGCYGQGAQYFNPQTGTVTVGPGQCFNIPVDVPCPTGLPAGQNACFQVSVFNHDSGKFLGCTGSVRRAAKWCGKFLDGGVLAQPMSPIDPNGPVKSFQISLTQIEPAAAGPVDLPIVVGAFNDNGDTSVVISLNSLPPGTPVVDTVQVPPGGTGYVALDVGYTETQDLGYDIVRLVVDDNADSLLDDTIVELAVRAEPTATVGLPPEDGDLPRDPADVRLFRALPNPFQASGRIEFEILGERQRVRLRAYDLMGRLVRDIIPKQFMDPGVHRVDWDGLDGHGRRLAGGMYFLRLETRDRTEKVKVVLMR